MIHVSALHHVTIGCAPEDLPRLLAFYTTTIGLQQGYRPALRHPGYWLYAGGHAIALLCTDVSLLHLPAAGLAPLPPAMALPGRPIRGLAQMDGAVLCLSSARDLAEYVKTMIYETH